jgi:hypothetical protein
MAAGNKPVKAGKKTAAPSFDSIIEAGNATTPST